MGMNSFLYLDELKNGMSSTCLFVPAVVSFEALCQFYILEPFFFHQCFLIEKTEKFIFCEQSRFLLYIIIIPPSKCSVVKPTKLIIDCFTANVIARCNIQWFSHKCVSTWMGNILPIHKYCIKMQTFVLCCHNFWTTLYTGE